MWSLLMLVQTAAEPPLRVDLKPLSPEPTCRSGPDDGEIVVCGERDQRRYRLNAAFDQRFEPSGRAKMRVSDDATAAVEAEGAALASGITVSRLMARLKIVF